MIRTEMCVTEIVKGSKFLRRVQKRARQKGLQCAFVPAHLKGSHGMLFLGSGCTTLKDRKKEIGPGLLHDMCKDLGIDPREL